MTVLSIGDQVRPGRYTLHSCFRNAANFTAGKRLVSLVTEEIGPGPLNIMVRDLPSELRAGGPARHPERSEGSPHQRPPRDPSPRRRHAGSRDDLAAGRSGPGAGVSGGHTLRVGRYSIVFANRRLDIRRAHSYASLLNTVEVSRAGICRGNLAEIERVLVKEAHPKSLAFLLDPGRTPALRPGTERAFQARITKGAGMVLAAVGRLGTAGFPRTGSSKPQKPELSEGVRLLAGCGFGLTPSGDDFLAGVLVALNVIAHVGGTRTRQRRVPTSGIGGAIGAAARSENPLSNAFLDMARRGRVGAKVQALVTALTDGTRRQVRAAARAVLAVGATSGADFATGFLLTLKTCMNEKS